MRAFDDPKELYFFFDYISHNAYLAWHAIGPLARKHGLALVPVPVVFGAMLTHYGQVGPAEVPAKSRWMLKNVLRKARAMKLEIAPPHSHPFNPLTALRATLAAPDESRNRVIDRLFAATWAKSKAVSDAAVIGAELSMLGLPAAALLEAAGRDAVKQELRENTEAAIGKGVFGVPSMIARGELFWGYDDFADLDAFLSGNDPVGTDRAMLAPWFSIKPSVTRKRP